MKVNYVKHSILNLINISKIVTIHYYEFDKNFNFDGESHNFWEMVYVDRGQVCITADNDEFILSQGEVAFHKPNEFHTIRANGVGAPNVFVISFVATSKLMEFFEKKHMKVPKDLKNYISVILSESERSFDLMPVTGTKLQLKEDAPLGGQQLIKTTLEQFLILLSRSEQASNHTQLFSTKESMENHLVQQIIGLIEENVETNLPIQEICKKLNYSKAYLSRIFKEATGLTIGEYHTKSKIKKAKQIIRENDCNFSQTSDLLGFDNPHYFSRVFKRVTKMTPTEYKNSVKNMS